MSATHFHAGHNMPGYMPMDDESFSFESFADAKASMIDDLDRDGDFIFSAGEDADERGVADEYSAAMEELNLSNGPEWSTVLPTSTSAHDLGESYWITACNETECVAVEPEPGAEVCTDCLMVLENNDTSGIDDASVAEILVAVAEFGNAYSVTVESHFSWNPCACCKRPLGGDRHGVSFV